MGRRIFQKDRAKEAGKDRSASLKKTATSHFEMPTSGGILFLQKNIGNKIIQQMVKNHGAQAKLKISRPNDKYEQEADRVAEEVLRMSEHSIRRKPNFPPSIGCQPGEHEEIVQTRPHTDKIKTLHFPKNDYGEEPPIQIKGNSSNSASW